MTKISERSEGTGKDEFRRGRGCVDQIFGLRIIVKKLEKNCKMFAAFRYLEKAYDRNDRKDLWVIFMVWVDICLEESNPSIRIQVPLCK